MNSTRQFPVSGNLNRVVLLAAAWLTTWCLSGCAAFHPIHGVPARYLPDEFRGYSRAGKRTIDLSLLKQTPPKHHLVDAGDVLGIYIEGVLGDRRLAPPVNIPLNNEAPPSFGFPIPVREDGTISLPLVGKVSVRGLSISEVEQRLKEAYTRNRQFLNPENDRILVSLQRPRNYRVLVIRQEAATQLQNNQGMLNVGTLKRGTGQLVSLPAYKNDVLHALAQTGGLPGLDAENAIYIVRRRDNAAGWSPIPGNSLPNSASPIPAPTPAQAKRLRSKHAVVRAQSGNWSPPPADRYSAGRYAADRYAAPSVDPRSMSQPVYPDDPRNYAPQPNQDPYESQGYPAAPVSPPQYRDERRNDGQWPSHVAPAGGFQPTSPGEFQHPMPPSPRPTQPGAGYSAPQPFIPAPAQPPQFRPQPEPDLQPAFPPGHPAYVPPSWEGPPSGPNDVLLEQDLPRMTPEEFGWDFSAGQLDQRRIMKIPVRLGPGETVDIKEQDIILEDGDIVFIESRDTEVFYTGGLLGGGQFTLPRDYDLNVLQAIAVSQAQRGGGGGGSRGTQSMGGPSALNNDVSISASSVVILRYLPDGRMVPIEIDLYAARTDLAEQVIIQPGDYILLQYTKGEAIVAFIERHLLEGALFGVAAAQLNKSGGGN